MLKWVTDLYARADGVLKRKMKLGQVSPSCRKGCAHCCYMMAVASELEGLLLAGYTLKLPEWKEVAASAREAAVKGNNGLWNSRKEYFRAKIPCPLLNTATLTCKAYKARPAACRFYLVLSDPALCASTDDVTVPAINTAELEALVLKACFSRDKRALITAPLPLTLLFGMVSTVKPSDREYLISLTQGLPTPLQWIQQFESGPEWESENVPETRNAYSEAFQKVFGQSAPRKRKNEQCF